MKRHHTLIPLSHDHQHGLAQALRLRRAAAAAAERPGDEAASSQLERAVDDFAQFMRTELVAHFAEEEQKLAPLLERYPLVFGAALQRMAREHAELRERIEQLLTRQGAGDERAEAAGMLGAALHDHIRWEERELFRMAQDVLEPDELAELDLAPRSA